jgi:predicted RNase H-like nuclease (RuvC/YqgF family)
VDRRSSIAEKDDELERLRKQVAAYEKETVPSLKGDLQKSQEESQALKMTVEERDSVIARLEEMLARSRAEVKAKGALDEMITCVLRWGIWRTF